MFARQTGYVALCTYWWKAESSLKLGESAIMDLICTEAEALCPAIKVAHQSHLLCNAVPYNGDLAVS